MPQLRQSENCHTCTSFETLGQTKKESWFRQPQKKIVLTLCRVLLSNSVQVGITHFYLGVM